MKRPQVGEQEGKGQRRSRELTSRQAKAERAPCDRSEATEGRPGLGPGQGRAGPDWGPPRTTLRVVTVATLAGSQMGKTEGERGREAAPKDGSPDGVGGVPVVPGPRRVPGLPGFSARGASGRVAAAPPSPSERSAAAGPNYRSHQREAARCGSRCPLGAARSPSQATARPGSGISQRPSAVLSPAAASQAFGLALCPPERTPSSTPGGTVCGASGRAQTSGRSTQPR